MIPNDHCGPQRLMFRSRHTNSKVAKGGNAAWIISCLQIILICRHVSFVGLLSVPIHTLCFTILGLISHRCMQGKTNSNAVETNTPHSSEKLFWAKWSDYRDPADPAQHQRYYYSFKGNWLQIVTPLSPFCTCSIDTHRHRHACQRAHPWKHKNTLFSGANCSHWL